MSYPNQAPQHNFFSTGLFDCCADPGGCGLCLCSAFCPCYQYGKNVEKMGSQVTCGGSCGGACCFYYLMSLSGLQFVPQFITRGELQRQHGHTTDAVSDCLVTACCGPCELCQASREIDIRQGTGPQAQAATYGFAPPNQNMAK